MGCGFGLPALGTEGAPNGPICHRSILRMVSVGVLGDADEDGEGLIDRLTDDEGL